MKLLTMGQEDISAIAAEQAASVQALPPVATVSFKPLDTPALMGITGSTAKQLGGWTVEVCAGATNVAIPRERLMQLAPGIHELPNSVVQDLLARSAGGNHKAIWSTIITWVTSQGGGFGVAYGIAKQVPIASYSGAAAMVGGFLVSLLTRNSPNSAPYYGNLLPSVVGLAANSCASYMIGAQPTANAVSLGPLAVQ